MSTKSIHISNKAKRGFTLIELLVVIAIIGLLASIVAVAVNKARSKARDVRRQADLKQLAVAMELYLDEVGSLPNPDPSCGSGYNLAWSSWLCWDNLLSSDYIQKMPEDPKQIDIGDCGTTQNCLLYTYCRISSDHFVLVANLENPLASPVGANSECAHGGPNHFWVSN